MAKDINNNQYYASCNAKRPIIQNFYKDLSILITGGTGFLGKVLIEKILRSCADVKCLYILLRPKRGLTSDQRYSDLVQNPVRLCSHFYRNILFYLMSLSDI